MSDTPTMNDLLNRAAEKQAYDEANAYPTLRRGQYRLQATKVEDKILGDLSDFAGKPVIHLTVTATNPEGRKGTLFVDITPETLKKDNKPTNRATRLFANYLKAFNLPITTLARELVDKHILQYPVDGFVEEGFVQEGIEGMKFYKTEEERKALVNQGWVAKNWVTKVYAIKG